jgi:hypothetical protein
MTIFRFEDGKSFGKIVWDRQPGGGGGAGSPQSGFDGQGHVRVTVAQYKDMSCAQSYLPRCQLQRGRPVNAAHSRYASPQLAHEHGPDALVPAQEPWWPGRVAYEAFAAHGARLCNGARR